MSLQSAELAGHIWSGEVLDKLAADQRAAAAARAAAKKQPLRDSWTAPPPRDIFEGAQPGPQCAAAIGGFEGKDCYICGFKIGPRLVKGDPPSGLSPECEHILAVTQAVLLYDLVNNAVDSGEAKARVASAKGDSERADALLALNAAYKPFFEREYRWSHQICNQIKSHKNIISYVDGRFIFDGVKLDILLTDIYNATTRPGNSKIRELVDVGGFEKWKASRHIGVEREVGPLVAYLNDRLVTGGPGMFALTAAANLYKSDKGIQKYPKISDDPRFAVPESEAARGAREDEAAAAAAAGPPAMPDDEPDAADLEAARKLTGLKRQRTEGGKRRKTHRMRRCRLPKLL